jgi:tetratricopeptide (TPR) repeat protein
MVFSILVAEGTSGVNLSAQQTEEWAQNVAETEKGLIYQRRVQLPQGTALPAIVMTEFLTHGELAAMGANLAVYDSRRNPVPWRVLQYGPGDYCRLAFQTVPRQHIYKVYYGGKGQPDQPPPWTSTSGLLLETRHWKECDLNNLNSLRDAWKAAEAFGVAYVPAVFHRFNPFWPNPEPFLSEYRGMLRISRGGLYRFFTSSQDCSFLLIDGKLVVASPGWHGPIHDSRFKGEVDLSAGPHDFQYLHAAAAEDACMVAAWQPPGAGTPETIPALAFGSESIAVYPALPVHHLHEYSVDIAGEVPVAESEFPLVRVQFRNVSARPGTLHPKVHWTFGDGQTSVITDPVHIYLSPGIYTVTMKVSVESDTLAAVNRVPIHRALVFADESHPLDQLSSYLAILDKYNPAKLDARSLLQLVRAFDQAGHFARAARAGQAGILTEREPMDSQSALEVVRLVGGLLRDRIDDPNWAFAFWRGAVKALGPVSWKAECEIEAADLAIGEVLQVEPAKQLLDSATTRLAQGGDPTLSSRLNRVWGDWYARKGDKTSARAAYERATAALGSRKSAVEQDAWRGALSRSTEEFLRTQAFDRAWAELRRWQEEYPFDKVEGYLTLLQARYFCARSRWPQAIALAGDLVAINPDSPYADRLVFLAAECQETQGHGDRARAAYQSLVTDYPGSPLVEDARKKLAQMTKKQAIGCQKP